MELDRTEIVIRQRSSLELMDLSLLVVKRHYGKLLQTGAMLGIPLLFIDVLLIHWMIGEEAILSSQAGPSGAAFIWWRYTTNLSVLYAIQFPLASLPVTLYLGAQTFFIPITIREIWKNLRELFWPVVWVLGVMRFGLAVIPVMLLIWGSPDFTPIEGLLIFVAFPFFLLIRTFTPFSPEILGLERCPIRSESKQQLSYWARRGNLHGPLQGDLFVRMIVAVFNGVLLAYMLAASMLFLKANILGDWSWNTFFFFVVSPLSLWVVGIFLTVYRYLSYIDSRIRLEGWEIELRMRAEANRLESNDNAHVSAGTPNTGASVRETVTS